MRSEREFARKREGWAVRGGRSKDIHLPNLPSGLKRSISSAVHLIRGKKSFVSAHK